MQPKQPRPDLERLYAQLRLRKLRTSSARDRIFEVVSDFGPLTIQQLVQRVSPGITVATVYRNATAMLEAGVFQYVFRNQLELTDRFKQHHHYFHCRTCGRQFAFNDVAMEKILARMSGQSRFTIEEHRIELSGVCRQCLNDGVKPHAAIGTNLRRPPGR